MKRVVVNGCFDILHVGHVRMLYFAASLGDELIVLVNSDESVRRLKGPTRPVNTLLDRAEVLRSLSMINNVIAFNEDTAVMAMMRMYQIGRGPSILVKGSEYVGCNFPERELVESRGGQVLFFPMVDGFSSTAILRKGASNDRGSG